MRIGIIGVGLIGGSIGAAARRSGHEVAGSDPAEGTLDLAVRSGVIDTPVGGPAEAAAGRDIVIIATPGREAAGLLSSGQLAGAATVTDVVSTKFEIVRAGEQALGGRFVGGHPMAGSERHGIAAADPEMFEGASWILTPTELTSTESYKTVTEFVSSLGAVPVALDPGTHDELLARLSHLPQLVAAAVVGVATSFEANAALLGLAAGGFRDVTRIAASHPDMWVDILSANRKAVLDALADLQVGLTLMAEMLAAGDWPGLRARLDDARVARSEYFRKPDTPADSVVLTLLVPDRPGVLAEVTTAAGELGANIEDLQIFHSTEGGRGRLDLVVAGGEAASTLANRLQSLGYHVDRGLPTR